MYEEDIYLYKSECVWEGEKVCLREKGFRGAGEGRRQEKDLIKKLLFVVAKIVRLFESICKSSFHTINFMQI